MSLLLDLSRLRGGAERVTRRIDASEFGGGDDQFRVDGPVELDVEVQKDAAKVRLTGHLSATLMTECSRCVEPFAIPVDARVDSLFLPAADNTGGPDDEVASEQLAVSFYKEDVIDLGEVVRELIYLALPMKPLCQPECRGLCPVCGVNRNRETCACRVEWVDPRLEGLRRLVQ